MKPLDLYFSIVEDGSILPVGEFEIQVSEDGNITGVWIIQKKFSGKVDINEFVTLLVGERFLKDRADKAKDAFESVGDS